VGASVRTPNSPERAGGEPPIRARVHKAAARRMALQFALFAALLVVGICLTTILLDPLQFYRRASLLPPVFSTEERYQNPGLAKNYDYDTIIIGTSMTENFLPSVVDKALKGKTMKLSMEGSMANEQYKIAKLALETGKVKKVLWGLDYFALKQEDEEAPVFPDYLYDDSWLNDYRYWFNATVYEMLFKNIVRLNTSGENRDLETLYNWNSIGGFGAARVMDAYHRAGQSEVYFKLNEEPLDTIKTNFETYVLSLAKRYPDVEFIYFYPPYSILRQDVWKRTNETRYANQLEMSVWMFEQLNRLPNAKVYNFQAESEWTYDLDLYRDLSHYKQDVNTWIAESIGRDDPKYRMTEENAEDFARRLEAQLQSLVLADDNRVLNADVELREGERSRRLAFSAMRAAGEDELLVPAKEAAAAIGATASWDSVAKELTLRRGERSAVLKAGTKNAELGDGLAALGAEPRLIQGTLMVPLLSAARILGVDGVVERPDERTLRIELRLPA